MFGPRWKKVLADLWNNKTRTLLTILTIAVGVFAVGFVTSVGIITIEDMEADFQSANAHGAIIFCDPFDDELVPVLEDTPGVGQVEGRSQISGRVVVGTETKVPIGLLSIPSAEALQVDRLMPSEPGGSLALADHEVLLEQSALAAFPAQAGDVLKIELPDGRIRELRVAALVHDVGNIPYAMLGQATAYVTPETMAWLGGSREYNELFVTVTEKHTDITHVTAVAQSVADKLKKSGRQVYQVFVYEPGRHFAQTITEGILVILNVLGALAVFLSTFLVINTISSLLAQHTRQIGVMKAVGGGTLQIAAMYLGLVLTLGALALALALPLSTWVAYGVCGWLSDYTNFVLRPMRVPMLSLILQIAIALLVPLAAASVPVWNGARISVREAISSYGLGKGHFGASWIDRLTVRAKQALPLLSRPMLISLRNTIRRKLRLILTLSTLTLGGAIFIAVFNLRAGFAQLIVDVQGYYLADVNISFNQAYRLQKLDPLVMSTPGVAGFEGWGISTGQFLSADRASAIDILFFALPADSRLIKPIITDGRWLLPQDENAVVIGNHLLRQRPELRVGDEVFIKINDKETCWHIVGLYKMSGNASQPILYVNDEYLASLRNETDMASNVRVITTRSDAQTQTQVLKMLEAKFKQEGIQVAQALTGADWQAQQVASFDVFIYFLLVMAALIAVVGGLGLMGTMSMNVMERSREIGVMRAIGASNGEIMRIVLVEGMLIGLISWVLAIGLSVPTTSALNVGVGTAVLTMPMDFSFNLDGLVIWLGGALIVGAVASAWPAWNAMRMTVREVLAYE